MASEPELLFLDTETTGNVPGTDRLCQVCYKRGNEISVKNFKPPIPISVKAMSIIHITNAMVEHEEAFAGSAMYRDLERLLSETILVAHNAKFDIAMLEAEGLAVPRHICTLRLARYLDQDETIPEYNLQYLRYHFGIEIKADAHSAEGDVVVLEAVFGYLYDMAAKRAPDKSRAEIIEGMIAVSLRPSLIRRFAFGKYVGEPIEAVARRDRGYLEWLLREKRKDADGEEDWIYTLERALNSGAGEPVLAA